MLHNASSEFIHLIPFEHLLISPIPQPLAAIIILLLNSTSLFFFPLFPLPWFFKSSTYKWFISVQVMSLCDPMDCSTPGFPDPYHFLEFAQVHMHCISDAIQPSHPLLPSFSFCHKSFPASGFFPMSWLFVSGVSSIGVSASALVFPMIIQGWFPFRLTNMIAFLSWKLSRVFSAPQFKNINFLVLCILYVQLSQL